MPRKLKLNPQLSSDEMEQRYRAAKESVERSQWQIVWLLSTGKTSAEISRVTGYCVDWMRQIVRGYNANGPQTVGDQRQHHAGQQRLLAVQQEAELAAELDKAAAAGQAWGSVQVAAWMSAKVGRAIRQARGWATLQRLNFSTKTPRTRHAKADAEAQAVFKKSLS